MVELQIFFLLIGGHRPSISILLPIVCKQEIYLLFTILLHLLYKKTIRIRELSYCILGIWQLTWCGHLTLKIMWSFDLWWASHYEYWHWCSPKTNVMELPFCWCHLCSWWGQRFWIEFQWEKALAVEAGIWRGPRDACCCSNLELFWRKNGKEEKRNSCTCSCRNRALIT